MEMDINGPSDPSKSYGSETPGAKKSNDYNAPQSTHHTNHGYQHEDEYPEEYPTVQPTTINTHHTVTAGQPHSTKTPKALLTAVWKRGDSCIIAMIVLTTLGLSAVMIWASLSATCALGRKCGEIGKCISYSQWCNGKRDCAGGEDEADCPSVPCRRCGEKEECVSSSLWCDGWRDCSGEEDEAHCFRLYGPDFLLQSFSNRDQKWKPVCSHMWDDTIGRKICSEIGYGRKDYVGFGQMSPGGGSSDGYMILKSDSSIRTLLTDSSYCPSDATVTLKCIECGKPTDWTRIVGGQPVTSLTRWPWQVSLQSSTGILCGGSIIAPSWIVTAAHCIKEMPLFKMWTVYAGYLTLKEMESGSGSAVSRIFSHPGYEPMTKDKDIALMKLERPLSLSATVQPVCLPNAGLSFPAQTECFITGWGRTSTNGLVSDTLREARVSLISSSVCNSSAFYNGQITDTMICAGRREGGVDTCQGDSGGPLVTQANQLWWLVGDTSWGDGCGVKNKPGVYGNVTYFLEWIYEKMQKY